MGKKMGEKNGAACHPAPFPQEITEGRIRLVEAVFVLRVLVLAEFDVCPSSSFVRIFFNASIVTSLLERTSAHCRYVACSAGLRSSKDFMPSFSKRGWSMRGFHTYKTSIAFCKSCVMNNLKRLRESGL